MVRTMNIVSATGHLPASRERPGGQKTSYSICEYLAQRHWLHVLAFATANEFAGLSKDDL